MRDSVKDALDGLVLQVNARIDPKDLRRIESAIGQTRGQAHAEISKRDIEDIKRQLRQMDSRAPVKPVLDDNAVAKLGRELDEMKAQIKARVDLDKQSQAKAIKDLKGIDAEIDAKVEISGSDIAEIKEKIANIKSDLKVNASLEKAAQNKLRSEVEKIDAKLKAQPELDSSSAKKIREEIKALGARIETDAHLSEASKKKIKHELNKLDGKATVNADLDDGKARFDLARLTNKPYFVDIHARLAKASIAKVAAQLKALAGGNIFGNLKNSLSDLFTNLDTVAVKMASVGVAAGGLISVLGSGLGVVSAFGIGVAHSLPALLALPGILGAAGAGIGVFVAAMKDAKDVLADLGPRFTALQKDISLNFWGEAADAVRNFANSALDALGPSISNVAAEMGMMAAAVADSATEHIPGFAASLEYLRQALDIGGDGAGAFTDALLSLGEVGAKYLPAIAGWANGVAYSFQNWVQAKIATGEMDQAIQGAAKTFGTLKNIVFDLGGIIGGLFTAMAAGSAPIDSIAGALDRANQAINGPLWQGTLTSIFSSMATAANLAFQGVGSLGTAFVSLAPTLSTILPLIGQIIQTGLNGISLALQDPAFQGGLVSFFQGVLTAVQALAPAMPALGQAFGAIATVAGQLLAAIALAVCLTIFARRGRTWTLLIIAVPLAFTAVVTITGSFLKIFSPDPKVGYWANHNRYADALRDGLTELGGVKGTAAMEAVVRNTAVQTTLSVIFLACALVVIAMCVWQAIRAVLAGGGADTEDPPVQSEIYAPAGMSATASEKELVKQWNDYYTEHPEADLRGGSH
nr:MAG TPA: tail tape measure [Caudoviricetes sp.]